MGGKLMTLYELRQKPHLSASSVGDYIDCGMLYKFGRVDRLPREFAADAMEFGTVIHKVLAEFYQAKMIGDRMMLKDIHNSFKKLWKQTADGRDDIQYAKGKDFDSYLMQGLDLLSAWYHNLSDENYSVLAIEEAFSFELPNIPIPIIGAIDLIEESGDSIVITDFKTAGKAYSIAEVDNNSQMTVYQLAAKSNGFADREILLRFDCLIKTIKPKFETYYTVRSEVDEKRLIKKIQQVWDGISKGVFVPNDTSWKHKNCSYRKVCDQWFLEGGG
jgi:putative RecB family exonuclease